MKKVFKKVCCRGCGGVIATIYEVDNKDSFYETENTSTRYIDKWGNARDYCKKCVDELRATNGESDKMQKVLQTLQKELEKAQRELDRHEARRDMTARGSASWRFENDGATYYRGEVDGLKKAIWAIESAGVAR